MPRPKSSFDRLLPCDFYEPDELLDADRMYTVYEIARLLQGLDPGAELEAETEDVLLDWAIPWVIFNADDLVIAEPEADDEPGYYGLKADEEPEETNDEERATTDDEELAETNDEPSKTDAERTTTDDER